MNLTPIEWTDFSANPLKFRTPDGRVVWACEKLSPGCKNCYAEDLSHRYGGVRRAGEWNAGTMATLTPFLDEAELHKMLTAKSIGGKAVAGSRCFVGDMTDIFGAWVRDALLDRLFAVFALRPDVTFQILTKRAERLRNYMGSRRLYAVEHVIAQMKGLTATSALRDRWPLPNVWLGVSVENPPFLKRLDDLMATPAAVRFVSLEPLLADVGDLQRWLYRTRERRGLACAMYSGNPEERIVPALDWVIVGGESGPQSRPFDIAWARSIVVQCKAAGVPVFVKQLGAAPLDSAMSETRCNGKIHYRQPVGSERDQEHRTLIANGLAPAYSVHPMRFDLRDRKGGDPSEWPEDLRVREMPAVTR